MFCSKQNGELISHYLVNKQFEEIFTQGQWNNIYIIKQTQTIWEGHCDWSVVWNFEVSIPKFENTCNHLSIEAWSTVASLVKIQASSRCVRFKMFVQAYIRV